MFQLKKDREANMNILSRGAPPPLKRRQVFNSLSHLSFTQVYQSIQLLFVYPQLENEWYDPMQNAILFFQILKVTHSSILRNSGRRSGRQCSILFVMFIFYMFCVERILGERGLQTWRFIYFFHLSLTVYFSINIQFANKKKTHTL